MGSVDRPIMQDDHICIAAAFVPIQVIDRLRLASTHFELCTYSQISIAVSVFYTKEQLLLAKYPSHRRVFVWHCVNICIL